MTEEQTTSVESTDASSIEWLAVPDFADRLGTTPKAVRSALADDRIVGVKQGQPKVLKIPALFLVPYYMANPADVREDDGSGKLIIMPSLRGTIIALRDARLTEDEIMDWLLTEEESLGDSPVNVLIAGNKSAVRRATQALLW